MRLEPHLSFGPHPDLGVVAEVAASVPPTEQVLCKHHFRQHPESGQYFLPSDAPYNRVLRAVTGAAGVLQDAGLSVAADPRLLAPPPVPQPPGTPARDAVPAQSLTALTAELHTVDRAMDAAEILQELLDEDFGAMGELEQLSPPRPRGASAWTPMPGANSAPGCAPSPTMWPSSATGSPTSKATWRSCRT